MAQTCYRLRRNDGLKVEVFVGNTGVSLWVEEAGPSHAPTSTCPVLSPAEARELAEHLVGAAYVAETVYECKTRAATPPESA